MADNHSRPKADQNVVSRVGARGDPEAAIDEQDAEEDTGHEAEQEAEHLERFAVGTDVMGGREEQAGDQNGRHDVQSALHAAMPQRPDGRRQEDQPEQEFLVTAV